MKVNDEIIQAFLSDQSIDTANFKKTFQMVDPNDQFKEPDYTRKDVVIELNQRVKNFIQEGSLFNHQLIKRLFVDQLSSLNNLNIYTTVGSAEPNDIIVNLDENFIAIDLHLIANYTRELDKMMHIIRSVITKALCEAFIIDDFKTINPQNYVEKLSYIMITQGLVNFICWGPDYHNYLLKSEKYDQQRQRNESKFLQASQVEDPSIQSKLLYMADHGEFWSQYAVIHGLFYWEQIARDFGEDALIAEYKKVRNI